MATLLGIAAGTLLTGLALSAFGDGNSGANSNTYTATFSQVTESLSEVMQRALQETNQSAVINQSITIAPDADFSLCSSTNIKNEADVQMQAIGTFNSQSAATIQNAVNQAITNDLTNNSNITTSFLSWLPKNTTLTDLNQTMHSIVRNVYTSENLNSMRQSIMANQNITIHGKMGGTSCNITNKFSAKMLAQNSLQSLTNAMFSNSFTQEAMNSIKNKYTGTARGPLDFLGDIGKIIAYAVIGIVAIVIILIVIGMVIKLTTSKNAPAPQQNSALTTALIASSL